VETSVTLEAEGTTQRKQVKHGKHGKR